MVKKLSTIILLLFFVDFANSQENTTIPNADPFCSDTGILFNNTTGNIFGEAGPNYGCLAGNQPRPSWFYIRIDQPGDLSLQIEQNTEDDFTGAGIDVDFIAWGPFRETTLEDIQNGNYDLLSPQNEVDCSWSNAAIETLDIVNAETGSYYLILITNWGGGDGFIRMYENFPGQAGTGTTDCSIVAGALDDQDVCLGEEVRLDGAPISGEPSDYTYKWFLDIGDGNGFIEMVGETNQILVINNDVSGVYKIEVTDDTGETDEEEAAINFYSQPTITPLLNPLYEVFDLDGTEDNYTTINLRDLFDEDFLNGQDPTVYIVNYYQSLEDAEANENEIPNPRTYTNIHDNADLTDDIFARVVTIAAPNTCDPVVEPFKVLVKINQPPVLSADFRGAYCPLSDIKIAENFTITDSDDTGLDFFTIQISEGYSNPNDLLELTGTHPTVTARPFDIIEGKLILEPTAPATEIAYADLEAAVRDIIFTSTDPDISGERSFSFTIGDANYLPSTEHFYVYEENNLVTWSDAKNLADASTYFGLQGYLVTILTEEENQISGEQITGTGWIGASDEDREGEWKWVTGPEAGTLFWNGNSSGSPALDPDGNPYYSNWNNNEPNNSNNEDYAHITADGVGIDGSWNDLPNNTAGQPSDYQAKGYIVEYGGTPGDPVLNISTSTSIFIPEITAGLDQRNCTGGSVTLSASVTEGDLFWYDQPNGGTLIFTGDTFTTPVLNSSKTYYIDALPIGCDTNQRIAIEAIIDTTPIVINTPPDINRCDEDRVGFLDFDLQDTPTIDQVLNSLDPILNPDLSDFEVLYFDNLSDAELNTTSAIIANPYRVNTSTNPPIYARIHNIDNPNCFAITEFKLKVTDVPEPTQPINWRKCDDDTDGISSFLLNTKDAEILTGVANPGDYTISYHTDPTDAQTSSTTNAIDKDADYLVTNSQRVYVRVENIANTDCNAISDDSAGSTFNSFELIVDLQPVIVTVPSDINRCDEDRVGFLDFDLITDQTPLILNGLDPSLDTSVFEVLYFDNLSDAELNTTSAIIANPYRVNTSLNPTIYARVH
ncbi:hypothetical protein OAV59_03325, partial [Flavobacteriaceae bacterium]|nr:hypothetical protein [Flavobacteriaceae bacterium]